MKICLSTAISPEVEIYDTSAQPTDQGVIAKLLRPVVILRDDDGKAVYAYGQVGSGWLSEVQDFVVFGLVLFGAYMILKRVRR